MRRILILAFALAAFAFAPSLVEAQDIVTRMEREHADDEPIATPLAEGQPSLETSGSDVVYARLGDRDNRGYLARPVGQPPTAGIIVIHEWWGLNDNVRAMADRLAGEGYAALAVDLYEGEIADSRDQAAALMRGTLDRREALRENLRQAHRHLSEDVGVSEVGVIGWCFGGAWSLRTALMMGEEVSAAVIYYGRLVTDPDELDALTAPLLGIFGELDRGIPVETVREFEAALSTLGKDAEIRVYPDADHAFANPSGTRFNEAAATDAWTRTIAFLKEHLQ